MPISDTPSKIPPDTLSSSSLDRAPSLPSLCVGGTQQGDRSRIEGNHKTVHGLIRRYEQLHRLTNGTRHDGQRGDSTTRVEGREHKRPRISDENSTSQQPRVSSAEPAEEQQSLYQKRWEKLAMSLAYVIKDAVALSQIDRIIQQGQGQPDYKYYQAVESFTRYYKDILEEKTQIYLEDLDLDSMETTSEALEWITLEFVAEPDAILQGLRTFTATERLRILRALYRREIIMRLYYAGGIDSGHLDRQTYLKDFYTRKLGQVLTKAWSREDVKVFNGRLFCLFEPWELEQIVTVDFFLVQRVIGHVFLRENPAAAACLKSRLTHAQQVFMDSPITRVLCDLKFFVRAEVAFRDNLKCVRRQRQSTGTKRRDHQEYSRFAPHCFLFEQQATACRIGYNNLQEEGHALPSFNGDAVDRIPSAWIDAFDGVSPHCRAFGLALSPVKFRFKHFLDSAQPILPNDSASERASKLESEAALPQWTTGQPFEALWHTDKWSDWCDLGFVMWDRDRVNVLKSMPGLQEQFGTGWISTESLMDAMANVRISRRKDGGVAVRDGFVGSVNITGVTATPSANTVAAKPKANGDEN